jgi:L-fuculose-phosphate aldolase
MRLGDVPVAPYARPGTHALADGVLRLAPDHPAVLLANRGSVAASSLTAAVDLAEELETAAQVAVLLRGAEARMLTRAQVAELRDPH